MTDKKLYYKLDEVGFVGTQKKETSFKKSHIAKKTGKIFRASRKAMGTPKVKKNS